MALQDQVPAVGKADSLDSLKKDLISVIQAVQGNFDHLQGLIRETGQKHNFLVTDIEGLQTSVQGVIDDVNGAVDALPSPDNPIQIPVLAATPPTPSSGTGLLYFLTGTGAGTVKLCALGPDDVEVVLQDNI